MKNSSIQFAQQGGCPITRYLSITLRSAQRTQLCSKITFRVSTRILGMTIRQDIESRLSQYHISEETKETFREALSAHEIGHFRCVCCVLFPTIEREFRRHFFEDSARSINSKKMLKKLTNSRRTRRLPAKRSIRLDII